MNTIDSTSFRATHDAYERRFLNAATNYDKFQVFKDLMSWVESLVELNDLKDVEIQRLRKAFEGYDMSEYK